MSKVCLGLILLTAPALKAEVLRVYSEFTRFTSAGEVAPQDRGVEPRHILSPGVARNGHASFRIVLTFDKPQQFMLDIGQNPENAVGATLYDERDGGFKPVALPFKGTGENTLTFWMDLWVGRNAPVDRIKVEPQLYLNSLDEWYTYPMEVRILEPVAPDVKEGSGKLPPASSPADQAAFGPLRDALCGKAEMPGRPSAVSAASLIRRNAVEHVAIAQLAARKTPGRNVLMEAFLKASGELSAAKWCEAPFTPKAGPEWYLKMRDFIFRTWPQ